MIGKLLIVARANSMEMFRTNRELRRQEFRRQEFRGGHFEQLESRLCLSGMAVSAASEHSITGIQAAHTVVTADTADIAVTAKLTDAAGNELTLDALGRYIVRPGADIRLRVDVRDARGMGANGGVFAAYMNVTTDGTAEELGFAAATYGAGFSSQHFASLQATSLVNIGGTGTQLIPPGSDVQLLFTVVQQVGPNVALDSVFNIAFTPVNPSSGHSNIVFGQAAAATASYTDIQLVVAHPWQNAAQAADVNRDGQTNARDVLFLANSMLLGGARSLPLPTVAAPVGMHYDVNGDEEFDADDITSAIDQVMSAVAVSAAVRTDFSPELRWLANREEWN